MFDIKDVGFECVPHARPSMECHIMQYPFQITQTFSQFDTNYNIFRNVESFIIIFFSKILFLKKKKIKI
jgi:hypothetical protein